MRRKLALAILLFAASSLPASAAVRKGAWWAALDGWLAQPGNANLDVAVKDNLSVDFGGDVVSMDFDPGLSFRIRGGWRPPDETANAYSLSYWVWNGDESLEEDGFLFASRSDPLLGDLFTDRVRSRADLKATLLDLMLSRRLAATRRSSWHWGIGLRQADVEQDLKIDYFDFDPNTSGFFRDDRVRISYESKGIGLTLGIGSTFTWHTRWRTFGRAQVSMLFGDTEADFFNAVLDPNAGFFQTSGLNRSPGDDRVFQQLEAEARVIYNAWRSLDVSLGYWLLSWSGAAHVDRSVDDVQDRFVAVSEDLSFHGFVFSVSYAFP